MTDKEIEFERLVRKQKSTIYSVCYMFSKDTDEVADLFQEVLIHMWTGFDAFRGASSPKTWIYRIALNTCVSQERNKKRQGERIPLSMDIDPFEGTDERALQLQGLYKRISRLGLVDRSIILLWLETLSYEEIGQIVGISPKNVSVRLFRIKEELRKMSDQ